MCQGEIASKKLAIFSSFQFPISNELENFPIFKNSLVNKYIPHTPNIPKIAAGRRTPRGLIPKRATVGAEEYKYKGVLNSARD